MEEGYVFSNFGPQDEHRFSYLDPTPETLLEEAHFATPTNQEWYDYSGSPVKDNRSSTFAAQNRSASGGWSDDWPSPDADHLHGSGWNNTPVQPTAEIQTPAHVSQSHHRILWGDSSERAVRKVPLPAPAVGSGWGETSGENEANDWPSDSTYQSWSGPGWDDENHNSAQDIISRHRYYDPARQYHASRKADLEARTKQLTASFEALAARGVPRSRWPLHILREGGRWTRDGPLFGGSEEKSLNWLDGYLDMLAPVIDGRFSLKDNRDGCGLS